MLILAQVNKDLSFAYIGLSLRGTRGTLLRVQGVLCCAGLETIRKEELDAEL